MEDFDIGELAQNVNNPRFGDDKLGVMFYVRTEEDPQRTLSEGRKCFREREYVKIMIPGDRTNVIDRPVQRTRTLPTDDTLRFPQQYARFKAQEQQVPHDGTPLALWPGLPNSLVEELKYINVFTVEQLADISDAYASRIPQGYALKQKAAQFAQALKDQTEVNKLQSQLAERDNRIDALEQSIKDQAAKIEQLMKRK